MSICAFWQLYDNLVPLILSKTFGLGETMTGGIIAMSSYRSPAVALMPDITPK
ncbi:hypothetical protein Ana3638_02530 [Anaerocolumna sedimenticola]|uniref:Uncharacterized protein n=1 Tax=Anaerocolumna sedimenticola TaxID=2696063 RepID=A0A6P1TIR9_9FIRM|nr:hypothetical protein [Anaerocolumna sedimenticola]QHQ59816.1 hypothetical protein Ana3638_02530 [Anaerocolumna sedimenticola]